MRKTPLSKSALLAFALVIALGVLGNLWITGHLLPAWCTFNDVAKTLDLNGDGIPERLTVSQRHLSIQQEGAQPVQAPHDWIVSDAFTGDIDEDGTIEVVALAWRRGSFGDARPFWKTDSKRYSQHIFIFQFRDNTIVPTWMSSDVGFDIARGWMDARARLHLIDPQDNETIWQWESWGLSMIEGSQINDRMRNPEVTIFAVGDNLIHDSIYESVHSYDYETGIDLFDFYPLYEQVRTRVQSYDVAVVNQETIFVKDPAQRSNYPTFGTPQSLGDALADAGFDVVLGATNHANDQGTDSILDTLDYWRTQHPEITVLGLHDSPKDALAPSIIVRNGIRLALFNYTYGLNGLELPSGQEYLVNQLADEDLLISQVTNAESEADITLCFLHIGEEYATQPNDEQRRIAESLIDAGADAIICSHPHVIQPMEWITTPSGNTGVVFYSLGNFIHNQTEPQTALEGAAELVIEKPEGSPARIVTSNYIPLVCHMGFGLTQVYFLEDYTNELANQHYLNAIAPGSVSIDGLWAQWARSQL